MLHNLMGLHILLQVKLYLFHPFLFSMEISGVCFFRVHGKTEHILERLVCLEMKTFTILNYERAFLLIDVFCS